MPHPPGSQGTGVAAVRLSIHCPLVHTQEYARGRTTTTHQTYQWDAARFAFLPAAP